MSLSKREKILAAVTAGVLLALLVGQWGRELIANRFESLQQEAVRLRKEIKTSQEFLRRENTVQSQFVEMTKDFLDQASDQDLMTQMLAAVQAQAQASKIELQEINSLPFDSEEGSRKLMIKMAIRGSWAGLTEFFNQIQKSPHRLDIEEMNLDQSGEMMRCQMTLSRWSLTANPAP